MKSTRRRILVGSVAVVVVVVMVVQVAALTLRKSPERALKAFYQASDVAESQLVDPLILAGPSIVPLLVSEIRNREMPRRRYGVSALGHIGDPAAVPALVEILEDPSEVDYIRCDALEAIARIDRARARELAKHFTDADILYISELSREILSEAPMGRKTVLRVWLGDFYSLLFGDDSL